VVPSPRCAVTEVEPFGGESPYTVEPT